MLSLLSEKPLRAAEAGLLELEFLAPDSQCLVVRNSGFGHIKRDASIRLIPLAVGPILDQLTSQREFIKRYGKERTPRLFLSPPATDFGEAAQALSLISKAIREVIGDETARTHSLRARAATNLMFPGWESLVQRLLRLKAGPSECADYFAYDKAAWTRAAAASAEAGHASRTTLTTSYIGPWTFLRSAALSSTLADALISSHLLDRFKVTDDARRKAKSRGDVWAWLQGKSVLNGFSRLLLTRNAVTLETPREATRAAPVETATSQERIRYVAYRLAGMDDDIAAAKLRLCQDEATVLEKCFLKIRDTKRLTRRTKPGGGERAKAADLAALDSPAATAWILNSGELATPQVRSLADLLCQTSPDDLDWTVDDSVQAHLAEALQALPDEYHLEFTFGQRHETPDMRASVVATGRTRVTAPQRDPGRAPRVGIVLAKAAKPNDVMKARLTVLFRILTTAFLMEK